MWPLLFVSGARAGGGAYFAAHAGGGWTDRLGSLQRGQAGGVAAGLYFGQFRGTYRFGDYWRVGLSLQWNPLFLRTTEIDDRGRYVRSKEFIESLYMPSVEIGRGADLVNLGAWWLVSAGPVVVSDGQGLFAESESKPHVGTGLSGAVGGAYNFGRSFAITARATAGVQFLSPNTSVSGGLGLGVLVRLPLLPLGAQDDPR